MVKVACTTYTQNHKDWVAKEETLTERALKKVNMQNECYQTSALYRYRDNRNLVHPMHYPTAKFRTTV